MRLRYDVVKITAISEGKRWDRAKIISIRRWALPCSLAVTEGILVSFFSSADWGGDSALGSSLFTRRY